MIYGLIYGFFLLDLNALSRLAVFRAPRVNFFRLLPPYCTFEMSVGPTAKVPDTLLLENRGESWKQFRREWKFYKIATKISKDEDEVRIAALKNMVGQEGMDLFDTFQ